MDVEVLEVGFGGGSACCGVAVLVVEGGGGWFVDVLLETLQHKYSTFGLRENISGESSRIGSETPITSTNAEMDDLMGIIY
jgi:hypothetical protein